MIANTLEKVLSKIEPVTESGCWIWMGYTNNEGYGRVAWKGKMARPHRIIYESLRGPIQEGMLACHSCDVPSCCNPDHIFMGTERDNAIDAVRKGRMSAKKAIRKRVSNQLSRTHCKHGHPLAGENLAFSKGYRKCKICMSWKNWGPRMRQKMLDAIMAMV